MSKPQMPSDDLLVGSDTYDILGGIKGDIVDELLRWGGMEQQDLVQTPQWAAHVSRLLNASSKEIGRLRALVGAANRVTGFLC